MWCVLCALWLGAHRNRMAALAPLSPVKWCMPGVSAPLPAPCRYGDYSPITKGEEITAIFVIIVGSASVGFLVGNISSVVNSRHTVRKQRMAQVRSRPCRFALGMGIYLPWSPARDFHAAAVQTMCTVCRSSNS